MVVPESQYQDRFEIVKAKQLKENLQLNVYTDALTYLTGKGQDQRGLSLQTLEKYNVGLGSEKFTNDNGIYQSYDSIYFPLYQPRTKGRSQSRLDSGKTMTQFEAMMKESEAECEIEGDMAELVKMKIRAAYKPNKSKQRVYPQGSNLR